MFHKKAVFKNLAVLIGKHLCWNVFFNENANLQSCNFIKKRLQHSIPVNIAKFLRTPVLKNIGCERLFQRFPIWINNMTSNIWSGHFLKKEKSKTQLDEKTCLFMMLLIISFLSVSPMHVRRRLSYVRKDDSSERL